MKKLAFFLLAGITLVGASCKGGDNKAASSANGDAIEAQAHEPQTNIRYVVSDSIQNNYVFAEETQQQLQQLELEYRAYENQLASQLQNMQATIQQKANNGLIVSQDSYNKEMAALQQKASQYEKLLAQRREEIATKQAECAKALSDSVNNFIELYNREHKYDAILYKESCLYLNPALDITQEIVDGLNKAYRPATSVAPAAPAADAPAATPAK